MKLFFLASLLGLSLADSEFYGEKFTEFKKEFGKQYETAEEELKRFRIFKESS